MDNRLWGFIALFAAISLVAPTSFAGAPCESLKARIEAKIKANGTGDHELEIVAPEMVLKRKVIGTCRKENKKIIYKRGHYEDLILSNVTKEVVPDSSDDPNKKVIIKDTEHPMVVLVGHAEDFDCNDPAYANVEKVETFTMVFANGQNKALCRKIDKNKPSGGQPVIADPKSRAASVSTQHP